jgi:hypothetical protein
MFVLWSFGIACKQSSPNIQLISKKLVGAHFIASHDTLKCLKSKLSCQSLEEVYD